MGLHGLLQRYLYTFTFLLPLGLALLSEEAAIISLYCIKSLIFVVEMQYEILGYHGGDCK
jgi:hypothetical protein